MPSLIEKTVFSLLSENKSSPAGVSSLGTNSTSGSYDGSEIKLNSITSNRSQGPAYGWAHNLLAASSKWAPDDLEKDNKVIIHLHSLNIRETWVEDALSGCPDGAHEDS